jgi:hypothetical protein
MIRIRSVKPLKQYAVMLILTDGSRKTVDLAKFLRGPIFEPIRNSRALFKTVHVDKELGTIVWDNGADIDPDVLVYDLLPAWKERAADYTQAELPLVKKAKQKYRPRRSKRPESAR